MNRNPICFILISITVFISACALPHFVYLDSKMIKDEKEISGNFTLILYGDRYLEDIEVVAVLDLEGDEYVFEPYAPEYNYTKKKNLAGKEALRESLNFVRVRGPQTRTQIRKLSDKNGRIVGYEVRPLFMAFRYGVSDVLNVRYSVRGEKVVIFIDLKPSVQKIIERDPADFGGD
jgi:hypothetical protein